MNIFRILGNALVFFLSSKQRQIIKKQKQIRKQKRERTLPGPYLQPKWLGQPTSPAPVAFLLLPVGAGARGRRARASSCFHRDAPALLNAPQRCPRPPASLPSHSGPPPVGNMP